MADEDIVRELRDGRDGLDREAFRALVPEWPGWLRVLPATGVEFGPEAATGYHTWYARRHYVLVGSPSEGDQPAGKLWLYGIWHGLLTWSWTPLWSEQGINSTVLDERLCTLRRDLPEVLAGCDVSIIAEDGGLSAYDRQFEGARLLRKPYYRWSEDWDHDHCVFCCATFSLDEPGALTEGYAVQDDPKHGDDYNWICVRCLEERRGLVRYEILGE